MNESCAKDFFNTFLSNEPDITEPLAAILASDTAAEELHRLCEQYAELALNATPVNDGAEGTLLCVFPFARMEKVKNETATFIRKYAVKDLDSLFTLIKRIHPVAVRDEYAHHAGFAPTETFYNGGHGLAGYYFNRAELPDAIFSEIENDVKTGKGEKI